MTLSLTKEILPGTWRHLGQRYPSLNPGGIPIAGSSVKSICDCVKGDCYKIGRVMLKNAFLVLKDRLRLLYVSPVYKRYRDVASIVFPEVPWQVDYDHALAKNICSKADPPFPYVLLLRVPPGVNRQHGYHEKIHQLYGARPDVCFADDRILDKWLGRPPKSRSRHGDIMAGYSYKNQTESGLTLRQRGKWAYAIGMSDDNLPMCRFKLMQPSSEAT
jgi:hypothetical protein